MIHFDVFGRSLLVERTTEGWRAYWAGSEGKRRPAEELLVPADVTEEELEAYLADLCHEWATPEHTEVRRIDRPKPP